MRRPVACPCGAVAVRHIWAGQGRQKKQLTAVPFRELSMYKGGEASAAKYTCELL